jgi:tetratricopeptide (TPR) repeat protein
VYENDAKCLLSREPHKTKKTGETTYGWIIGQDRKPLYAVQSGEMMPLVSGWRKFNGALPLPQLTGPVSYADGASEAAEALKSKGNALYKAGKFAEAEAIWTRGLGLAAAATTKVALYSNRAEARLRLQKWEAALIDAQ